MSLLLDSDNYGERRGAAYGLAGLTKGLGILALKQLDIMNTLTDAMQDKKNPKHREGSYVVRLWFILLTRCVAMPSVMAAGWVGTDLLMPVLWTMDGGWIRTLVLFLAICGPKYTYKFACAGLSIVCNSIFRLMTCCCIPEIFAIKLRSCPKSHQNFMFLGHRISGRRASQISDRIS